MKTDFTQTGKRTWRGALKDGHSSIKRFFLGNFFDNKEQVIKFIFKDFIDFSLCKLKPKKNIDERIRHSSMNSLYLMAIIVIQYIFQLIAIPFLVMYGVNSYKIPLYNTQKIESNTGITVGISILLMLMTFKTYQISKGALLRKPIRHQK